MEIQIITGFLGAGKTTFLNKYLPMLTGKTAVIENEFGDIGIDGDLIKGDIPIEEIYAGCICCSLAMDFRKGIKEIADTYHPDRILIEPSGVGRLSDVVKACRIARTKEKVELQITKLIALIDAEAFEDYVEGFGAFYQDQIEGAKMLLLSNIDEIDSEQKKQVVEKLRELNPTAVIYDGDWRKLEREELLGLMDTVSDYDMDEEVLRDSVLPAGKVFSSVSVAMDKHLSEDKLEHIVEELAKKEYGYILRAKGNVVTPEGKNIHLDYTPFSSELRGMDVDTCDFGVVMVVIGCDLNEGALKQLFEAEQ